MKGTDKQIFKAEKPCSEEATGQKTIATQTSATALPAMDAGVQKTVQRNLERHGFK